MAPNPDRDILNAPLGLDRPKALSRPSKPWGRMVFSAAAIAMAGGLAYLLAAPRLPGGEPVAVARIEIAKPPPPDAPASGVGAEATGSVAVPKAVRTAEEVEAQSGVRIVRPNGQQAPGSLIINVPESLTVRLNPAPDKRLVERGPHGPLPKIGADGARASEVYARPVVTPVSLKANAPRIALVVGGLGLNAAVTAEAIAKLPAAVTLAFAPYGTTLGSDVASAREEGHEVLLQLPLEPLDYPANNPGQNTLLSGAEAARNPERLAWLMSRFAGYVGVSSFLGGRILNDTTALAPVLREIGERGLLFVDDGASPQSAAIPLASTQRVPAVRADVVLDASDRPDAFEAALTELERLARQKTIAVGFASGLPRSIDRIARFARSLESRGIALVPVSAAVRAPSFTASGGKAQ